MKTKLLTIAIALAAIVGGGVIQSADALGFSVGINDRPYYEGPYYWNDGYRMVWIPGHVGRDGRWVHGHYRQEGVFVRGHMHEHHVVHMYPY